VSAAPTLDPNLLRASSAGNAPDPIFTELPDDLPAVVEATARSVTADAESPYEQAIALQAWFRNEFEYSLEVQSGHGSNAIESFLQERIGYCEQFSATFAAMARTLGIPSRVAVGFTPGVQNAEGWYSVLGKNAHAWPELWFDGIGWVLFEPTPGRGAPGAEAYTGIDPAQDTSGQLASGDGGGSTSGDPLPTTPSTVVAPPTTTGNGATSTTLPSAVPGGGQPQPGGGANFGDELADGQGAVRDGSTGIPWRIVSLVTLVAIALSAPQAVRWWRRRSTLALGSSERVQASWSRARRAAEQSGVSGSPAMTPREWATATAAQLPVAARPMASLAEIVDRVTFARPGSIELENAGAYGSTLRHDCELWSNQVDRIARDQLNFRQRVKRYFVDLR
jgi:Transglutaminase-like superfamily/Domain of unknown function (DUF4129)